MRLFIAIDPSIEVQEYIKIIQTKLDKDLAKLRLTSSFHLTLKFLGDVNEELSEKIIEKLGSVKYEKFELKTSNKGVFPNKNYIRVVWLGLQENLILNKLQNNIENALKEFKFKKDFKFHPHFTLARVSFVKDKQNFNESLQKIKTEEKSFPVKKFILYESTLTKQGPIYKTLKTFASFGAQKC